MVIKGKVANASVERRDLVGKDGVKRNTQISHVLIFVGEFGKAGAEVVNLRSYDEMFILPTIGSDYVTPPIKTYQNYTGVAEVMV